LRVDRRKLGPLVVGDEAKMAQLNGIVHPLVARERTTMVHACEEQGASLVVIDVPLLFETKGESTVDATLVVTCSPEEQRRRVLERENMTEEKFEGIRKMQMSDEEKRRRATHVISTECSLQALEQEVANLVSSLSS